MDFELTDLGVQSHGDTWCNWRCARHPETGAPLALGSLANNGFMLIDPVTATGRQIIPAKRFTSGWAIGQAPDGSIYQAGFSSDNSPNVLVHWNWTTDTTADIVAELPAKAVFTLDVAGDGAVYLPDYTLNTLFRFHPDRAGIENMGDFNRFGKYTRNVFCGMDGLVYLTCTDYQQTSIVAFNPVTGEKSMVMPVVAGEAKWQTGHLLKDDTGRILAPAGDGEQRRWFELQHAAAHPLDPEDRIAARLDAGAKAPLVFADGSYIATVTDDAREATIEAVDSVGVKNRFQVPRQNAPLRIFGVQSGADRIWGGTFIPITLFYHDPAIGKTVEYGNPTATNGEIYSMLEANGRLFTAAYTGATLTRFDPEMPWNPGPDADANPRHLGQMKEDSLPLHRPYGKTRDAQGRLFFSAIGDYGCIDSGICRIDPETETVTRWIFPETSMTAMVYLPAQHRILVSERRRGESALYATFVCPDSGRILDRIPMVQGQGFVYSWLHADGEDWVYGVHAHEAAVFAFSLAENRIVASLPNVGTGTHCHECLLFGPDGDLWCLTVDGVFAVSRDLKQQRLVMAYPDHAGKNHYRFGMVTGPDGAVYFPNGKHLMRVSIYDL